jgi:hypothetical protein
MYITLDLMQKRGACQEALDFFAKHFPNGIEMMDAIEMRHIPVHFLHWGYQHLDPNKEEEKAYWKRIEVTNSEGVHESFCVNNSTIVSSSKQVDNSEEVYKSENISNSTYIVSSEFVDNSEDVGMSEFVDNSENVLNSKNVDNSDEVCASNYVIGSHGVFKSDNIVNSNIIWWSNNLTDCSFCSHCADLKNALFCQGLKEGEYLLFNKPIDQVRYEMIAKQFKKYMPSIKLTNDWKRYFGELPHINYDLRKHIQKIPAKFWDWVKTLPGYDASIIYSLTFDPQFLN